MREVTCDWSSIISVYVSIFLSIFFRVCLITYKPPFYRDLVYLLCLIGIHISVLGSSIALNMKYFDWTEEKNYALAQLVLKDKGYKTTDTKQSEKWETIFGKLP